MVTSQKKTAEQWVEIIAQQELPAITSTVKLLDKFANDDVSSLAKLSKAILHDQALSSCVLKVANSIPHFGVTKVTTVSRAAVMLGIHTVKNICLTSKLIDGLLKSKSLKPATYYYLSQLMATSFYSGVLAKMMVPDYSEDTQEEVYLAAMLYRIGETAFWTTGSELTTQLLEQYHPTSSEFYHCCAELMGAEFNELSKGLAQTWKLGDLLVKALDQPESRTVEIQTIYLADKLSQFIQSPPNSIDEFNELLEKISKIMKVNVQQLTDKIELARKQAINLLNLYGAKKLTKHLKLLPTSSDFSQSSELTPLQSISREKAQLIAIKQLSHLTKKSKDFNEFLQLTLHSIAQIIHFERCTFLMLTSDKKQVKSRFAYDGNGDAEDIKIRLNIVNSENLISHVIKTDENILVNDYQSLDWRDFITQEISLMINNGTICLAPVSINNNCIGVISAQFFQHNQIISDDDFEGFCFLVGHLNMCLSLISRY